MLTLDGLRSSVNLYRGQVSFALPLATLPAYGGGFSLAAVYDANVARTVSLRNMDAPTGVLGLGWELPFERIVALRPRNASRSDEVVVLTNASDLLTRLLPTGAGAGGARTYAADNYHFWKILRHEASERWEITREDGVKYFYGDAQSRRSTVEYGVSWGNWIGSSANLTAQQPLAVGWALSEVVDLWGNSLRFRYRQTTAAVGGADGLPYTQAIYLSEVIGAADDRAVFNYLPKTADEYQDPHTSPAPPNAWQSRFETDYLSGIDVFSPTGEKLHAVEFDYTDGSGQTAFVGSGKMKKRLLTAVRTRYPGAPGALPGAAFTYVTDPASSSLGSLETVTTPEGGVAAYSYSTATDLPLCDREQTIAPPGGGAAYSSPRFWFDDDYTVVTWKAGADDAKVVAYAWEGRWLRASLDTFPATDAAYSDLRVTTAAESFGVVSGAKALAYHLDPTTPGAWVSSGVIDLILNGGEAADAACGEGFVAVLGLASGKLNRIRWSGSGWVPDSETLPGGGAADLRCGASARHNFIFSASLSGGDPSDPLHLRIDYLDALRQWRHETFQQPRPHATVTRLDVYAGDTFALVDAQSHVAGQTLHTYQVFYWSADYDALQATLLTQVVSAGDVPAPALRGSFVGIGQELFRFDGSGWGRQNIASIKHLNQHGVAAISYGYDQVLRTLIKTDDTQIFDLVAYDPDMSGSPAPWSVGVGPVAPVGAGRFGACAARSRHGQSRYAILPAAGAESSNGLYYQGPDGSWQLVQELPADLTADELPSLQLLGELYAIYQQGADTFVYPLDNGGVAPGGRVALEGRRIIVPGSPPATLVGQQSFVTYTGAWGDADSVRRLHRVVRRQVTGVLKAVTVKKLQQDTGYQDYPEAEGRLDTAYDFTLGNATADASGYRPAFNLARYAEDTSTIATTPRGLTTASFFNGLAPGEAVVSPPYPAGGQFTNAEGFLRLLGGRTYNTQTLAHGSATPASSGLNYCWVFTADLGGGRRAFYARVLKTDSALDQVPGTVETVFDTRSGLPTLLTRYAYNADGAQDTLKTELIYWWEKYDTGRETNLLTPVVQETESVNGQKTAIKVSTWTEQWGFTPARWAPLSAYAATTPTPADFNQWEETTQPLAAGWLPLVTVIERNSRGAVVRAADSLDRRQSSVFDRSGFLGVSSFTNADSGRGEAGYYGFEAYEANPDWAYRGGGSIDDFIISGQAHTGRRCLRIEPSVDGSTGPVSSWLRTATARSFVFSCWMLVPTTSNASPANAYWSIQVETPAPDGSPPVASIRLPFPAPAGKWAYVQQVVDLQAVRQANNVPPGAVLQISILGVNASDSYCLADEFRFSPLDAVYEATVYDPSLRRKLARNGENGATMRLVLDGHDRPAALVGPVENVVQIDAPAFARAQSADGSFDPMLPNSVLSVTAGSPGLYYDFDPSDALDWELPQGWAISDFELSYAGADGGNVPPFGQPARLKAQSLRNFAARARFKPGAGGQLPYAGIGLDDLCVYRDVSEQAWIIGYKANGQWSSAAIRRAPFGEDWVLSVVDGLILFYVGGSQVFAYQIPGFSPAGLLNLFLSGPGSFQQLAVSVDPQLSVAYTDGAGRHLQSLALLDNETVVATGGLFDRLRRPQRQKNAVSRPLLIRPIAYPQPPNPDENRVVGDISTYLANADNQPVTLAQYVSLDPPPFGEVAYEQSPLGRTSAAAAPGVQLAASAHLTKYAYAQNAAGGVMRGLGFDADGVAGQYTLLTVRDPDGFNTYMLANVIGQMVARRVELTSAGQAESYNTSKYFYDGAGNLSKIRPPNYFDPPPGSQASDWEINRTFTFLKQLAGEATPDAGTTQYKYDGVGRLQFTLDAAGAALDPQRILYYLYDGLNRPTEVGYVQSAAVTWDSITQYAQYAWPADAQRVWYRRFTYDADGSRADNLVGRLARVETNSLPGSPPDAESYSYDPRGLVLGVRSSVARYDSQTYQTEFRYNNLGRRIEITYPRPLSAQGTPVGDPFRLGYFFDRLGRLVGVGEHPRGDEVFDPDNPITDPANLFAEKYARYDYNEQGLPSAASLNNGGPGAPIGRGYAYDLSGRLTQINGDYYNQALTYESGGFGGAGYYNGRIASWRAKYFSAAGTDRFFARPLKDYLWAYSYDNLGRLLNASCTEQAQDLSYNVGVSSPVTYDANGNLARVQRGPAAETYNYAVQSGQNVVRHNEQLQTVVTDIAISENFAGNHEGWAWGASNAGPSASGIVDSGVGGGKCLRLAGGSLGHEEQLTLLCFLDVRGAYTLAFSYKADPDFAGEKGDAGWYLQFFTAEGETVRVRVFDASSAAAQWQQSGGVTLDCGALAATLGMNAHVVRAGLLLVNGKRAGDGTPAAALYVTDVRLEGNGVSQPFAYDANGNVTAAPSRNLTALAYEPSSGLPSSAALSGASAQSVGYAYGPGGRRSLEVVNYPSGQPDKTLYLRDPAGNVLMRRSTREGAESVVHYLRDLGGLLATHTAAGENYLLGDHLGSTRVVVSPQAADGAAPMPLFDYGPFGELLAAQADGQLPYRYTGQEQDAALGVYNYQTRLYDPALRRFYQTDPAGQYASPYVYVGNDPVSKVDPDGEWGLWWMLLSVASPPLFIAAVDWVLSPQYRGSWPQYLFNSVFTKEVVTEMKNLPDDWDIYRALAGVSGALAIAGGVPPTTALVTSSVLAVAGIKLTRIAGEVLDNLTHAEAEAIRAVYPYTYWWHMPVILWKVYRNVRAHVSKYGADPQQGNAARHFFWVGPAARYGGLRLAKGIGGAHESDKPPGEADVVGFFDTLSDKINNVLAWNYALQSDADLDILFNDLWGRGLFALNAEGTVLGTNPNVVVALTQLANSYRAALKHLKERFNEPPILNQREMDFLNQHKAWPF